MGLANWITGLRIALLPVVIYAIYQETWGYSLLAVILFIFMAVSDFLDGYVARRRNDVTEAGSFLDPLSDKIVVICLLIVFLSRGEFWLIPLLIFIVRDFVINGIRTIGARYDVIISADIFGKIKTVFQFGLILLLLWKNHLIYDGYERTGVIDVLDNFIISITYMAVLLAVFSVINYALKCRTAIRSKKEYGETIEDEKILVLANKKARGYYNGYRRRLLKLFTRKRKAELKYISPEEGMFDEAKKEIQKYPHIIIAGGDGSFESALNYPAFKKKVLGFFPLGAGNAFYSYFYKGKGFVYLTSKFKFKETQLDILEIEWDGGKKETTFLAIGVDAEVLRLIKKRTIKGFSDYLGACVKGVSRARADYDLKIYVDGRKIEWENCVNLIIGKVPYYGYGLRSMTYTSPTDGQVYAQGIVNRGSPLFNKFLRLWGLLLLVPLHLDYPPLFSFSGKEVEINSDVPFPIQVGGDFIGYSQKLKVKVKRKQKVLMI
ncbi:MAG: CDP-diacylglycerol--glycerol-3-phosphate 3-phosphatidyltransferase [Candidatus Woesearchaeota archaeon]